MGCRCAERGQAIRRGAAALVRGNVRGAATAAGYVARTLAQDTRSGDLARAAQARLAQMRATVKR